MAAQSVPRVELMNRHGSGIEPATFHLSQENHKNKNVSHTIRRLRCTIIISQDSTRLTVQVLIAFQLLWPALNG